METKNYKNQMLVSDISHQVKTPVSNLRMVTDMLLIKPVAEEERMDFLQGIRSQTDKLDFLFQALVKTSRLETGAIRLEKFVFEAPIDLLYFICLFPKNWTKRSYLLLGGVAGKVLTHFLSERPDIRRIVLCLDNDNAGNEGCSRFSSELPERLTVLRLLPAEKDWNEVLQYREEISNCKFIAETITLKEPAAEPPVLMIRSSSFPLAHIASQRALS